MAMKGHRDTVILLALTLVTTALAAIIAWQGYSTPLEAVSVVTGAICVWLTVKESVWNFPISLLNVTTFCIVYFQARLFADASLQIIYFVLTLAGWYFWLFGGKQRTALRIQRASMLEWLGTCAAMAIITAAYWRILRDVQGTAPVWDALTTALSLGAQWLLTRKRLENWMLWIAADVIYVPLYLYKGLYLTSILYGVFLVMATMGLFQWLATYRRQRAQVPAAPQTAEVAA